jgi:hypothetical protein
MRLMGVALTVLLLTGCAVVPLAPVAYVPGPALRIRYGPPAHPHHSSYGRDHRGRGYEHPDYRR